MQTTMRIQCSKYFEPPLECHELAAQFPDMSRDEFEALREDIRAHGLQHPIIVDRNNKIIDGRHRYRALLELYREFREKLQGKDRDRAIAHLNMRVERVEEGTEAEFALSSNLARRHLTPSQRCMIVALYRLYEEGEERKQGINISDLARRYGLQRVTLYKAEYVLKNCKIAAAKPHNAERKEELLSLPRLVIEGKRSVGLAEQQVARALNPEKYANREAGQDLAELARKLGGRIRRMASDQQTLVAVAPLLRKLERALEQLPAST